MQTPITMKNDIKNYLDNVNRENEPGFVGEQLYYDIIDDVDIVMIHNLYFDDEELEPCEFYNGVMNYYIGIWLVFKEKFKAKSYLEMSAHQNNVYAMEKLIKYYDMLFNHCEARAYEIILNNNQYGLTYLWNEFKINWRLEFMDIEDVRDVYKMVGDYYAKQHNYDMMKIYYKYADSYDSIIGMKNLWKEQENYEKYNTYYLAKKYNGDQELLKNMADHLKINVDDVKKDDVKKDDVKKDDDKKKDNDCIIIGQRNHSYFQ